MNETNLPMSTAHASTVAPTDRLEDTSNETSAETLMIPVIEEYLTIEKEVVETGRVLLTKTAVQAEQLVDTELTSDEVGIVRVPMNVYVDAPPPVRQEGDTTIIPILAEVAVVQKRLVVIEEVRITKRQTQSVAHHKVPLQRDEVLIERIAPAKK